jgi:hypothetical protein
VSLDYVPAFEELPIFRRRKEAVVLSSRSLSFRLKSAMAFVKFESGKQ